jgi:hypothetical protein
MDLTKCTLFSLTIPWGYGTKTYDLTPNQQSAKTKKTSLGQFMEAFLSLNFEEVYEHGVDNARHMEPRRKTKLKWFNLKTYLIG